MNWKQKLLAWLLGMFLVVPASVLLAVEPVVGVLLWCLAITLFAKIIFSSVRNLWGAETA